MSVQQRFVVVIFLGLSLHGGTKLALAQTPQLTPFYNAAGTASRLCPWCDTHHPGPDYPQTVYYVLSGFNDWLSAIEFSVSYPAYYVTWLSDSGAPPVTFGTTPEGISMAWGTPQNASGSLVVLQSDIIYHASCYHTKLLIEVKPNPATGELQAVRYGDNSLVQLQGGTAEICSRTIAAEPSTWGAIKDAFQ